MPLPVLKSKVFGRDEFEALMASAPNPRAGGWEVPIDRSTSVMMEKGERRNVLFVRRLKPWPKADIEKDYVRVWVYDTDGTLRTTAKTPKERAFLDEVFLASRRAFKKDLEAREKRVAEAIAKSPKIERAALEDAVTALTHGRVRVAPIVDAVMLAASDQRAYIAANREACAEYGVFEPTVGLHVIALLQHLPKDLVVYFDWKESMHEVLPMLARMLRKGPGVAFDFEAFEKKCDAWDRANRMKALKEIAPAIAKKGVVLSELGTESDAYSIVCVRREDGKRVSTWRRKAHLPMKPLVT